MNEFITTYGGYLAAAVAGLWAFFTNRNLNRASVGKIEGDNTDTIITRIMKDNASLALENSQLREENKSLYGENQKVLTKNEELLEELHMVKVKIAELTNEIIRLETKFRTKK